MVDVINESDPEKTRVECPHCQSTLEYTEEDLTFREGERQVNRKAYGGPTRDVITGSLRCPVCEDSFVVGTKSILSDWRSYLD